MSYSRIEIAGLWEKKDKNGNTYFVGNIIGNLTLVIFKNAYATEDHHPKYKAYISTRDTSPNVPEDDDVPF